MSGQSILLALLVVGVVFGFITYPALMWKLTGEIFGLALSLIADGIGLLLSVWG